MYVGSTWHRENQLEDPLPYVTNIKGTCLKVLEPVLPSAYEGIVCSWQLIADSLRMLRVLRPRHD